MMWAQYAGASLADAIAPLHEVTFHEVRRRENVGIRSGDIFINRDEVELAELQALEASEKTVEVAERIATLELNLKFCKERKLFYRQAHQDLKHKPKKMIVTIDFTAAQTGMQDKFSNFVVVVCTDVRLPIPEALERAVAKPIEPQRLREVEKVELAKRKRKNKKQIARSGGGRALLPSWTEAKAKMAKEKKLPGLKIGGGTEYKPCSTVFHFVLKRTDSTPGQTSPYVQWAMNFLFQKHGLAAGFDEVHLFSDGCGKHFKTYPTHWFILYYFVFFSFFFFYYAVFSLEGTWPICSTTSGRNGRS
jgi:hypothetical protein